MYRGLLIAYLASGGWQVLQLALPGLIAIPALSLAPTLTDGYLPLSRPATRGEQSSRNMGLMFVTMIVMATVMGAAYIAWQFEVLWYLIGVELDVAVLIYYLLNRIIKNRPLVRHYDG